MGATPGTRRRQRGEIETLPSGALRVRVYAGVDPVTKKRHYLVETVPKGPKAAAEAERVRTRLLGEVDAGRQPRTSATVEELLERFLDVVHVEENTRSDYESLIRVHIMPELGALPVGRMTPEVLDSFFALLRRCRRHCRGRKSLVDHRTDRPHECDGRCRPHRCQALGEARVRRVHVVLNSAFTLAERWTWVGTNVIARTPAPKAPKPKPQPPAAAQAARIATEAWKDPLWGMFVWLAMTTGARRGELCALRWDRVDFASGVLSIRSAIAESEGRTWEKDTKDHQQRRIVLDAQTLGLLRSFLVQRVREAETLDIALPEHAFVFSLAPDGSTWRRPGSATERYSRMCTKLGYRMHLHQLRHYSATELIASGVDIRTVAGRLGHGGGGTTTLRVYSAWVAEADQRASRALATRMPELPGGLAQETPVLELPVPDVVHTLPAEPASLINGDDLDPYRRIATDVQAAMRLGLLKGGDVLPTVKELAARYAVSIGTAQRAVVSLADEGRVVVARGKRTVVC